MSGQDGLPGQLRKEKMNATGEDSNITLKIHEEALHLTGVKGFSYSAKKLLSQFE